nr:hypothetical protein [Bacteroidota bacterium]
MKKIAFILIVMMFSAPSLVMGRSLWNHYSSPPDSLELAKGDSTEYELLVFDTGFDNWFRTNSKPIWYHENEYYRSKNIQYVSNWNNRVIQQMHRPPYEYEIVYDPGTDYGPEVNWKLFWYFKYLEHSYNISLGGIP